MKLLQQILIMDVEELVLVFVMEAVMEKLMEQIITKAEHRLTMEIIIMVVVNKLLVKIIVATHSAMAYVQIHAVSIAVVPVDQLRGVEPLVQVVALLAMDDVILLVLVLVIEVVQMVALDA